MAGTRTRYVNTASSAGGDGTTNATSGANRAYATLSAALGAIATDNLVTLDVVHTIYCEGGADTTACSIPATLTQDATRYLVIRGNTGHEAVMPWSTARYRLSTTNTDASFINSSDFTRIMRLQMENTVASPVANNNAVVRPDATTRLVSCLMRKTGGSFTSGGNSCVAASDMPTGKTLTVLNCVGYGHRYGLRFRSDAGAGITLIAYNNTFHGAAAYNISMDLYGATDTIRLKNNLCAAGGTGDYYFESTAATPDYDNNASSDATAPADTVGGATLRSRTFTFVDSAGGDFHLAAGDTGAKDVGVDLSADATVPFSDDFDAVTRSGTWDVGAHEYAAAASGAARLVGGSLVGGILVGSLAR